MSTLLSCGSYTDSPIQTIDISKICIVGIYASILILPIGGAGTAELEGSMYVKLEEITFNTEFVPLSMPHCLKPRSAVAQHAASHAGLRLENLCTLTSRPGSTNCSRLRSEKHGHLIKIKLAKLLIYL